MTFFNLVIYKYDHKVIACFYVYVYFHQKNNDEKISIGVDLFFVKPVIDNKSNYIYESIY